MRRPQQTDFFKDNREYGPNRSSHGGSHGVGKRKIRRPFKRNCAHHVMLKSEHARERLSLRGPRFRLAVDQIIEKYASRFGIKIHAKQNVGNHIHMVVTARMREAFQSFLRAIGASIAQLVTGARRGRPFGKRFWTQPVFTRIINGARDFAGIMNYVFKNKLEAEIDPLARKNVELWEAAVRKARRTGRDIWEFL